MEKISDHHYDCDRYSVYVFFVLKKLSLPILSAEKKEQIEADWNFKVPIVWFDKSSGNSLLSSVRYYGSYGGYDILFSNLGLQTDSFESISIAVEQLDLDPRFRCMLTEMVCFTHCRRYMNWGKLHRLMLNGLQKFMIYIREYIDPFLQVINERGG